MKKRSSSVQALPSRHPDNAPGQDLCLSRNRDVKRIVNPCFHTRFHTAYNLSDLPFIKVSGASRAPIVTGNAKHFPEDLVRVISTRHY